MKTIGLIGWRGLVGSILLQRLQAEQTLRDCQVRFFSTSQSGTVVSPLDPSQSTTIYSAEDLDALQAVDILLTCQGSDYTQRYYHTLRQRGWQGYWIDAASTLRYASDSVIVLDPVNRLQIEAAITCGVKTFVGANCTVSLLLMALGGLFSHQLVEWISMATYQAASGAGSAGLRELLQQLQQISFPDDCSCHQPLTSDLLLNLERQITTQSRSGGLSSCHFGAPLANNLLPWIDGYLENGQSREEWKSQAEAQKILGLQQPIPIDGLCVRVASLRCHSQALTIKLKRNLPLATLEKIIVEHNPWVRLVDNYPRTTLQELTPIAVAGSLTIAVGRLHKLTLGPNYLSVFIVGDQLLWGAAEPLYRLLALLLGKL